MTKILQRVHSSVVRAADCRSAGPWFESGCALKARLLHPFIIVMCEGGLITVMKAWADCRHRLPMVKPMPVVLKAEEPRCTNAITWVHSSVVRAADCRSAGPWFESGCALHRECHHWVSQREWSTPKPESCAPMQHTRSTNSRRLGEWRLRAGLTADDPGARHTLQRGHMCVGVPRRKAHLHQCARSASHHLGT